MLFLVHYCYRFLRTVVTIFCARLLPFSVHSLYHFLCTRNFCLQLATELTSLIGWSVSGILTAGGQPESETAFG